MARSQKKGVIKLETKKNEVTDDEKDMKRYLEF